MYMQRLSREAAPMGGPPVSGGGDTIHPPSVIVDESMFPPGSIQHHGGSLTSGAAATQNSGTILSTPPPVATQTIAATPMLTPPTPVSSTSTATVPSALPLSTPIPGQPSLARQLGTMVLPQVFGPSGPQLTSEQQAAQQEAARRARFTADNQPAQGVERVNPNYPDPPGTPEQLEAIKQEIGNLLFARAQSEQAEAQMAAQEDRHQAHQGPLQRSIQGTTETIRATQAHQQAVARRNQANQEQQQRQQEAQGLVAGYPSRASGMAVLTIPLAAFEGFTSLASELPGDAGESMLRMNTDARNIQAAFDQMATAMVSQEEAQPARQQELQQDRQRLDETHTASTTAQTDFEASRDGLQDLRRDNQAKIAEAQQGKAEVADQTSELTAAIATKQGLALSLAAELQIWATQHKAARTDAVAATTQRLARQGYIVHAEEG